MLQYQSLIAVLLILFLFYVPTPTFITAFLLWIIILIVFNQISNNVVFSFFVATSFLAIFIIFIAMGKKGHYIPVTGFRDLFVEQFEGEGDGEKKKNPELLVDNPTKNEEVDVDIMFKEGAEDQKVEKPPKISMMDEAKKDEEDVFGKLNADDFEESDDDTEADEDELEVGKSTVSSKQAYKAQKQLYDLTVATKKLGDHMEKLSGPLKKGQKIIESLEKFGLNKFV